MIPHIIHYCWFGHNPKSDEILKCMESWKKYLPDWKIIEWNEDNYNIEAHSYTKDAYRLKKWAFVSDLARMDILYRYGGVYLDVDVEFIRPIPEKYLEYEGFCGFEYTSIIAPGLIFGVEKENKFIKMVLDSYKDEHFVIQDNGVYNTINLRITELLLAAGLQKNNQFQIICGIAVFPSEYFCGYDTDVGEPAITVNTICWHHYLGSWSEKTLKQKIQGLLKRIIGVSNYRRLLAVTRKMREILK